jgi:hypothetical protein
MARFTHKWGWVDEDADRKRAEAAQATEAKRRAEADYARRQANAAETIPPTGKHHRSDGT